MSDNRTLYWSKHGIMFHYWADSQGKAVGYNCDSATIARCSSTMALWS